VYPGDIMVGDHDGVVCLPRELADEVAEAAVRQEHLEDFILRKVDAGRRCAAPTRRTTTRCASTSAPTPAERPRSPTTRPRRGV